MYGNRFEAHHYFFKEEWIELKGPAPKRPDTITVHFYQDGHVEVSISAGFEKPRQQILELKKKPRRCTAEDLVRAETEAK
jgi:hypothetical protein